MADQQLDRLNGRNGEIWKAYCRGRTQEWIASQFALSQTRVSQIINEVRATIPDEAREDWRLIALETLSALHAKMVEIVYTPAPPKFQNGEILHDEDGTVLRDYSDQLAAVDRVVKIQERAAKTLGTDAATKTEVTGAVRYVIEGVDPEVLR